MRLCSLANRQRQKQQVNLLQAGFREVQLPQAESNPAWAMVEYASNRITFC